MNLTIMIIIFHESAHLFGSKHYNTFWYIIFLSGGRYCRYFVIECCAAQLLIVFIT